MEETDRVCTIKQSKKLAGIGVALNTEKRWYINKDKIFNPILACHFLDPDGLSGLTISLYESFPAPNSDELIAEIPPVININGQSYNLIFRKATESGKDIYVCDVVDAIDKGDWYFDFRDDHLAWLLADVLIWIKSNNHTELEDMIVQNAMNEAETIEMMHRN